MNKCILIIDDDLENSKRLKHSLMGDDTDVYCTISIAEGLERLERESYQLVIFDLSCLGMNVLGLLQIIRNLKQMPIMVLSSDFNDNDKLQVFLFGADDVLDKQCNIIEFVERAKALMRCYMRLKSTVETEHTFVYTQNLYISLTYRKTYLKSVEIPLTHLEFDILYLLASNQGQVFTQEQIYRKVWGDEFIGGENSIQCNIRRIRRKLEVVPDTPNYIQTMRGVGYSFNSKSA